MDSRKINLADKLGRFQEEWTPHIIAALNGQHVKLAKLKGELTWHSHADEDELFLVLDGSLTIQFRDRDVRLEKGEMFVVPRGVEHNPVAPYGASVLLFEPQSTKHTGDVVVQRTVTRQKWIGTMPTTPLSSIDLHRVIRSTHMCIASERFAYLRVKRLPDPVDHLMCFSCGDDKTVVTRESRIHDSDHSAIEAWFRLIEFRIPTPFETPGFLAAIASALAGEGINLLIISTFPHDYVLVRDRELKRATAALQSLGFQIPNPT